MDGGTSGVVAGGVHVVGVVLGIWLSYMNGSIIIFTVSNKYLYFATLNLVAGDSFADIIL